MEDTIASLLPYDIPFISFKYITDGVMNNSWRLGKEFKDGIQEFQEKSYPKLPLKVSVLINWYPDGRTQFICHTKKQVEMVNRVFTDKGNMPINYEEWDDEEHRKYILTFEMLDGDIPLLRN